MSLPPNSPVSRLLEATSDDVVVADESDLEEFLKTEWSVIGTMLKVVRALRSDQTVTIEVLLQRGPLIRGQEWRIAANCFVSLFRLHQRQLLKLTKNEDGVMNIELGPGRRIENTED